MNVDHIHVPTVTNHQFRDVHDHFFADKTANITLHVKYDHIIRNLSVAFLGAFVNAAGINSYFTVIDPLLDGLAGGMLACMNEDEPSENDFFLFVSCLMQQFCSLDDYLIIYAAIV